MSAGGSVRKRQREDPWMGRRLLAGCRSISRFLFDVLKVLGDGELTKSLTVSAHRFSRTAAEKIQQAGGQVWCCPARPPL